MEQLQDIEPAAQTQDEQEQPIEVEQPFLDEQPAQPQGSLELPVNEPAEDHDDQVEQAEAELDQQDAQFAQDDQQEAQPQVDKQLQGHFDGSEQIDDVSNDQPEEQQLQNEEQYDQQSQQNQQLQFAESVEQQNQVEAEEDHQHEVSQEAHQIQQQMTSEPLVEPTSRENQPAQQPPIEAHQQPVENQYQQHQAAHTLQPIYEPIVLPTYGDRLVNQQHQEPVRTVQQQEQRSPPLSPPSMHQTTFSQQQTVTQIIYSKLEEPIQVPQKPVQNKPSIEFPRASYIHVEDDYRNGQVTQQVVVQPVKRQIQITQPVIIKSVSQPVLVGSVEPQRETLRESAHQSSVVETALIEPEQQFQILIPTPEFVNASTLHKMISSAYYQRKEINMRYFTRYMHNRNHYNLKHSAVLDDMTEAMLSKLEATNNFLDNMAHFIQHTSSAYAQFQKQFVDLQTFSYLSNPANQKTKNRMAWSINTTNGMTTLLATHLNCTVRIKQEKDFLLRTVQELKKLKQEYNKKIKQFGKHSLSLKNRYCDFQEKIISSVKNIHKKVKEEVRTAERKQSSYDLLELELIVLEWVQKSKQLLVDWGVAQLDWWDNMMQLDIQTVIVVRDLVLGVLQTFEGLHFSKSVGETVKYWRSADFDNDVRLNWTPQMVLRLTSIDFLRNSLEVLDNRRIKTLTYEHVSDWARIRNLDKTTGDKQVIIDSLSTKVFPCTFYTGKSWVTALLVATIDQNTLILTEFQERQEQFRKLCHYHFVKKVPNRHMFNTRLNEISVSINEKREGLFTDSWRKEQVQFSNTDEADEFMYFTENKTDLKKQYVQ